MKLPKLGKLKIDTKKTKQMRKQAAKTKKIKITINASQDKD